MRDSFRRILTVAAQFAVTGVAVALAVAHSLGSTLVLDSTTLALLAVATIPWLFPLIKSISLAGITIDLSNLRSEVSRLQSQASSTNHTAGVALSATLAEKQDVNAASSIGNIDELVLEYNKLRETPRSGLRTEQMTAVVGKMMAVAARTDQRLSVEEVLSLLRERNQGKRLYGFAYCYTHPSPSLVTQLVESLIDIEDSANGAYWGILALGKSISVLTTPMDARVIDRLERYYQWLPASSDRHYALSTFIKGIRSIGRPQL